ncbi:M28 family peptidase [Hymenobacter sp. PAMC 26628]|uniref:M28 family peptidase n=1 Tax=Hymenobacter sp. PAMC 26628 TaxID=1484118 RepID=UPI0007703AA6|nr:M28 family peptidase [Hymenobacter sp. PAMC 26628]AMJ67325.1 peptidase M28 [Hymenobacter sp. PAMC 26628]
MLKKLLLPALLALATAAPAGAQGKVKTKTKPGVMPTLGAPPANLVDWSLRYADLVTADRLRTHLSVLASDEYEGRETGQKGQHLAATYVAAQFQAAGLAGPGPDAGGPYLQKFQLESVAWAPGATLQVGSARYQWPNDFYGRGSAGFDLETTVQPVFVGYGIEQAGYSDYEGLDVAGKDVLILQGEPTTASGKPLLAPPDGSATRWGRDDRAKLAAALAKGVRSIFFVDFRPNGNFEKTAARIAPALAQPTLALASTGPQRPPVFYLAPAVGYKLLSTNAAAVAKYLAQTAAKGQPLAAPFRPGALKIRAPKTRTSIGTENALGFVEGTDKKDEILVVSAHHDHLGVIDGKVYNGADDDGSGTSALINLAEAFAQAKKDGHGPRRSILFLSVTGEEEGLFGSEYYAAHPVFPLASTVADLNVDMIGRTDPAHEGKPDYVYVIGSDKLASQLKVVVEAENQQYTRLALDYKYDDPADPNRFYYRSDHYNFAAHGVPVAFFFNGVHADYHQETDEIAKIQFDKMEARARLVFHTAWALANRDVRILVDSNKP